MLLFIGVPLLEIYVIIQVGQVIGPWWTILLLVLDSLLGAWLIRREGGRAWTAFTTALSSGRMPAREIADGALILVGGTLMLTPGFVTDVVALFLILPFTRPLARGVLTTWVDPAAGGGHRRTTPRTRARWARDPGRGRRRVTSAVDPAGAGPRTVSRRASCRGSRPGAGAPDRSPRRGAARAAP